jgi:hypothetical protein
VSDAYVGVGTISTAVARFLAEVDYPADDPRSVISTVAVQLAEALDRTPGNAALARELRGAVTHLAGDPNAAPDAVDVIAARRAARRVGLLLEDVK